MMFCHDQGPRAKVATDGMITTMIMALEVTMRMTTTLTTAMTMIVMMMAMAVIFVIVNTAALSIPLIIIIQSFRVFRQAVFVWFIVSIAAAAACGLPLLCLRRTAAGRSVQLKRGCRVSLDARLCSAGCKTPRHEERLKGACPQRKNVRPEAKCVCTSREGEDQQDVHRR